MATVLASIETGEGAHTGDLASRAQSILDTAGLTDWRVVIHDDLTVNQDLIISTHAESVEDALLNLAAQTLPGVAMLQVDEDEKTVSFSLLLFG